jgi:hypothetical protein
VRRGETGRPRRERTRETPHDSVFAKDLGNTGKSTARMHMVVSNIICALYVVTAGRGGIYCCCSAWEFRFEFEWEGEEGRSGEVG